MCFWKEVYYIVCRHYSKDPVECIEAYNADMRCKDWDAADNEMENQIANGTPYIKAVNGICMDCRYTDAANRRSRR
jgi:hypothetical protein